MRWGGNVLIFRKFYQIHYTCLYECGDVLEGPEEGQLQVAMLSETVP